MASKLEISREVAAKYLKGIVDSDKYAIYIARGIVDLVEERIKENQVKTVCEKCGGWLKGGECENCA